MSTDVPAGTTVSNIDIAADTTWTVEGVLNNSSAEIDSFLYLNQGGISNNLSVYQIKLFNIASGAEANQTTVYGGSVDVYGTADSMSGYGKIAILSGGTLENSQMAGTISYVGEATTFAAQVGNEGLASSVSLSNYASLFDYAGGDDVDIQIFNNGEEGVLGFSTHSTVFGGGTLHVGSGGDADKNLVELSGMLVDDTDGIETNLGLAGGTANILGTLGGNISFSGTNPSVLEIGSAATIQSGTEFTGFAPEETIILEGMSGTASFNSISEILTIGSRDLQFSGVTSAETFVSTPITISGTAGTAITLADVACFAAGTRIMTSSGELPVEALFVGDKVQIMHSNEIAYAPITLVREREVDVRHHPDAEKVSPILFKKGCLGLGVPHRDTMLSPDHAVYHETPEGEEIFILARDFRNGKSIYQLSPDEMTGGKVTYFHVEVGGGHQVLFANGMAAESYLNTGNHDNNFGAAAIVNLHPVFETPQEMRDKMSKFEICPYWDPRVAAAHEKFRIMCEKLGTPIRVLRKARRVSTANLFP